MVSKYEWVNVDLQFDGIVRNLIASAIMIYIVQKNVYELHPMDEHVFNDFIDDK